MSPNKLKPMIPFTARLKATKLVDKRYFGLTDISVIYTHKIQVPKNINKFSVIRTTDEFNY